MEQKILANDLMKQLELKIKEGREEKVKEFSVDNGELGFWLFCKYVDQGFFKEEHGLRKELCRVLHCSAKYTLRNDESYSSYKKIAICVFPRMGKSYITSLFCVWVFAQNNSASIMRNAATATLAEKFSRDIRNLIQKRSESDYLGDDEYSDETAQTRISEIYPSLKLSKDKKGVDQWALTKAKDISYICCGVGGSPTGFGCDTFMIMDDPIKDPASAYSDSFLDGLLEWYVSTHRTRADLSKNVGEIIIMARWSTEDLLGKLLKTEEDWNLFIFSAEDENGKSAYPTILNDEKLTVIRNSFASQGKSKLYNALYIQEVSEMSPKAFSRDKMTFISRYEMDLINDSVEKIQVDYANEGKDYFASVRYLRKENLIYVKNVIFTQKPSSVFEGLLVNQIISPEGCVECEIEANNGGLEYARIIREKLEKMNVKGKRICSKRTNSNKHTKILSMSGTIQENFVFSNPKDFSDGHEYKLFMQNVFDYKKEGGNTHDDAPDVLSAIAEKELGYSDLKIYDIHY